MSCCFASKPTSSMRVKRRRSRRSSSISPLSAFSSCSPAATPASIFMARSISSAAVSSGTLPISFRYMRTGSPVSMVTLPSPERLRAARAFARAVVTLGSWTSVVALSSSSGMPSSRSSSSSMPASILSSASVPSGASVATSPAEGSSSPSSSSSSSSTISSFFERSFETSAVFFDFFWESFAT